MAGKKKKVEKGIAPIWIVHFDTNRGSWPVSMRASNSRDAAKKARVWLRKVYPETKIIKLARVKKRSV
jgi:hypothetical protein